MIKAGRIGLLALLAGLIAACGPPPTITGGASPSSAGSPTAATASPSANPSPQLACSSTNRCLVLVTLRGSTQVVVRDITDIAHPKTVSNLGAIWRPQFVAANVISYIDGSGNLIRMPLSGAPKNVVAKTSDVFLLTWSPDGSTAAYITNNSERSQLHLVSAGHDRVAASMEPFVGGCETQACGAGSDFRLAYSQDGNFISLTQPWGGPNFRVWSAEGTLLKSNDPNTSYSMSTWSGNGLYFVDASGVVVWRDGATTSFLPGVHWTRPKGSPIGRQIVYSSTDTKGWDHVYVVDTATKKVQPLKSPRSEPVFLTSRFIWYQGERACAATDPCDGSLPVIPDGKTYIYDLKDGTESSSVIASVVDVWPHAA